MKRRPVDRLRRSGVVAKRSTAPLGGRYGQRARSFEILEQKNLLAGDVMAILDAVTGELAIVGGDDADHVLVSTTRQRTVDVQQVFGGKTTVLLDTELLEEAANLVITSATPTAEPADNFPAGSVAFAIEPTSDFQFATDDGFAPISGEIAHSGSITFNDAVTVGDLAIGFDAERAAGDASGFYVRNTLDPPGSIVLFDISLRESTIVDFTDPALTIGVVDLLVSPEFAGFLADDSLTGADVGDAQIDALTTLIAQRLVNDGGTSVNLDTDTLESAAGLILTDANGTADPTAGFQVAFDITRKSDFQFSTENAFTPLGGEILHRGSIEFNDAIELGDFAIALDPERAEGDASGFFLRDTLGEAELVLFDIALRPDTVVNFDDPELTLGIVDLLVAPELANFLGNDGLTGADVGDAQIDAETIQGREKFIRVRGRHGHRGTTVNGERAAEFLASDVESISIDVAGGSDSVSVYHVDLPGALSIDLGDGRSNRALVRNVSAQGPTSILSGHGYDTVRVQHSNLNSLSVETGDARDVVSIRDSALEELALDTGDGWDLAVVSRSDIRGDVAADMGGGWDTLAFLHSRVLGHADLDGGSGFFDRFYSGDSEFGSLETSSFLVRRIF